MTHLIHSINRQVDEKENSSYGWVICFACTLLLFCTAGLTSTGFSVYQPYLIQLGGLSNAQSSLMITFRMLFSVIGMLTTHRLIAQFEVRRVVSAACFIAAISFLAFGFAKGPAGYIFAASLGGFSLGCGGMIPASILISRWFNEHRGLALGICMASTGFSAIIASPLITLMVERLSLRASFLIEAAFVSVSAIIVYALLHSNPSCIHARPVGRHQKGALKMYAAHDPAKGLYWFMVAGIFLFGIPSNLINTHISVLYRSAGYPSAAISTIIAIMGGLMTIGKCTYGQIADKLGVFKASSILYTLLLLGISLCCFASNGSLPVAVAAASLTGFGLAVTSVSVSVYASKISTEAEYGHTLTCFQICSSLGALLFGPVPGIIADRTGSYVPAFILLFCVAIIAVIILLYSYWNIRKQDMAFIGHEYKHLQE